MRSEIKKHELEGKRLTIMLQVLQNKIARRKRGVDRPSPEVNVLLSSLILAITAFQFMEDHGGHQCESAEDEKCLVQAVNYIAGVR